jgi:succinate dehydrogenase / fumarate reductase flavoprotein subunit
VPRDIATREIFSVCTKDGLSVDKDKLCVYLDLTHIPRATLDAKLKGILEIYEKFQGVDPRDEPMKIFPAVHYSMGGLWVDYERAAHGGLVQGSTRNQQTNIPGVYAIGECDYQYHGANRLGANSLLSCIFSGLIVAPGIENRLKSLKGGSAADQPSSLYSDAVAAEKAKHDTLLRRSGGNENPYLIHQELGFVMTKAATVVRENAELTEAIGKVNDLEARAAKCSLSDTGNWTNQNVVFTKALVDMFPIAKAILQGALQRDECRGAHYKPAFEYPGLKSTTEAEKKIEAEGWCDRFAASTAKWLKSTIATKSKDGTDPILTYEDVDTSLIPPRPRLYGLVGAELIEQAWKQRAAQAAVTRADGSNNANGAATTKTPTVNA